MQRRPHRNSARALHGRGHRWQRLLADPRARVLAFLIGVPAVFSLDVLRASPGAHAPLALGLAFASAFFRFGLWMLAAGALWRLMARVPLQRRASSVALHLGATSTLALAVSSVTFALQLLVRPALLATLPAGGQLLAGSWTGAALLPERPASFVMSLPWDLLISWAALSAVALSHQALRARDRAARALALGAEVDQVHLRALEAQLHPHFLFNALNTVSSLLDGNPRAARAVLRSLRRLFGRLLTAQPNALTTVEQELALVRHYLAIERARYGQRLRVRLQVAAGCERALIPGLLLQPLIENAVRHGVARRTTPVRVRLRLWQEAQPGHQLHIEVHDDGPGVAAHPAGGSGIGLSSTRARLAARYGSAHHFAFHAAAAPWGGARVEIALPFTLPCLEPAPPPPPAEVPRPAAERAAPPSLCAPVPGWRFGWGLFALAMVVLNLLWCSARHFASAAGAGLGFQDNLAIGSRGALAWVLLFPLVAATSAALDRSRLPPGARALVHGLLALAVAGAKAGVVWLLQHLGGPMAGTPVAALIAARIYSDLLHYAVMTGICHALFHHARARALGQQAARLEAELAAARLGALRLRLEPASLLESLATLESLVMAAPAQAERLVAALGDRLRGLLAAPLAPGRMPVAAGAPS